jgi:hypothetical protein
MDPRFKRVVELSRSTKEGGVAMQNLVDEVSVILIDVFPSAFEMSGK